MACNVMGIIAGKKKREPGNSIKTGAARLSEGRGIRPPLRIKTLNSDIKELSL
jgi:hypothetical protein